VTAAELEHELANIAHSVAMASPEAIRYAKQCIDRGVELDPQGALGLELMAIEAQLASGKGMGKP
jgi:enoyl-CoA hydratase